MKKLSPPTERSPHDTPAIRQELFKRQDGIVSSSLSEMAVAAIGMGAGSQMSVELCKHGVGHLAAVEFDNAELHNNVRTAYAFEDCLNGRSKLDCFRELLRQQAPLTQFLGIEANYCELTEEERAALYRQCDLILFMADSFEAARMVNEDSLKYGVPAIFIGIHALGLSGRIVWQVPGITTCYECVALERFLEASIEGDEAVDLPGGSCVLADVKLIDAVALKIVLALLDAGNETVYGRLGTRLLAEKRNEIIVRTDPTEGFGNVLWNALLEDLPANPKPYADELKSNALFAMDTIWLPTQCTHGCENCCARCS